MFSGTFLRTFLSRMASSKDDVTRLKTITLKVGEFLRIFVKDDENNQMTSACLYVCPEGRNHYRCQAEI